MPATIVSSERYTMMNESGHYLLAVLAGLVTAAVQSLAGINLGEAVYDGATIGTSSLSVLTGLTIVSRAVGRIRLRRSCARNGDLWTWAAILAIGTTGLSAYHWMLMVYWGLAASPAFRADEVEAAFRNWHILFGITFSVLHLFLFRVMKVLPTPAPQPDQE